MKRILKISQTKEYPDLYLIVLDDESSFYINLEDLIKSKFTKNSIIESNFVTELSHKSLYVTSRSKAFRKAALKEYSVLEISQYLHKIKTPTEYIQHIVDELIKKGTVNDARFSERFLEKSKISRKPKGKLSIKYDLLKKGISEEVANSVSENINIDNLNEYSQKYINRFPKLASREVKTKLIRHLASRGFEYDIIKGTVDSLFRDQ